MITSRTLYVLTCDRCATETTPNPPAADEAAMKEWAAANGWVVSGEWCFHAACARAEADPELCVDSDNQVEAMWALSDKPTA